jgi:hypothetical protein
MSTAVRGILDQIRQLSDQERLELDHEMFEQFGAGVQAHRERVRREVAESGISQDDVDAFIAEGRYGTPQR